MSTVTGVKVPLQQMPSPLPPPYPCRGKIWGGQGPSEAARHACRQCLAVNLARSDCEVKFPAMAMASPSRVVVKFGVVRGPSDAVRHACRQCHAGNLAHCNCEVTFPGNWHPRPLPPPALEVVKYVVVRGRSSDHAGLGSNAKTKL